MSAREAVEAAIARAQAMQPKINFLVTDTYAQARTQAATPGGGGLLQPAAGKTQRRTRGGVGGGLKSQYGCSGAWL